MSDANPGKADGEKDPIDPSLGAAPIATLS